MLYHSRPKKIYYYGKPVDFRKQTSGLGILVDAEFPGELIQGSWFLFVAQDRKKAKILYWRDTGFALWQFRLEKELFDLGSPRFLSNRPVSWRDLGRLLDGLNIFEGRAHEKMRAKRFA